MIIESLCILYIIVHSVISSYCFVRVQHYYYNARTGKCLRVRLYCVQLLLCNYRVENVSVRQFIRVP